MQNQPAAQSQPPAARQMDQSLLSMDPVQRQVFICLLPFRGQMSLSFLTVLASNITFLIKDKAGYKVEARQVSITKFNVSDNDHANMGQIATISVHKGPDDVQLVLWSKTEADQSVIISLDKKVEFLLKEILREVFVKDSKTTKNEGGGA